MVKYLQMTYKQLQKILNKSNYFKTEAKKKDLQIEALMAENRKLREIINEMTN